MRRVPLFVRHHLPHLVPILAISTAQQCVASLVAVAELGVLGIFVGATKLVTVADSAAVIRAIDTVVPPRISDIPEWGGLLANGRGIENLWTTRWVILVPGVAFALAAMAMSAIGLGIARQYQRRNALYALRSRGAAAIAMVCAVAVLASILVPERYVEAREWADNARARVTIGAPLEQAFAEGGLRPVGSSYVVTREVSQLQQVAPASISIVGAGEVSEKADGPTDVLPVLYFASGGAVLDAPIVYAGWGLSPADHPETTQVIGQFPTPNLGTVVKSWADDYAAVDVRGKVAVVLRMPNIQGGTRGATQGQDFETTVKNALKRGAVSVVYIDPALPTYPVTTFRGNAINPYRRLGETVPLERPDGQPVFVLSLRAAERLLAPLGVSPTATWDAMGVNTTTGPIFSQKIIQSDDPISRKSLARDLGTRAHVDLQIARVTATPKSLVGVTPGEPSRVLIWAVMPATRGSSQPAADALAAFIRSLAGRTGAGIAIVAFDRTADPIGNARAIAEVLGRTRWDTIVVLDDLEGDRLRFETVYGDLIPMFDEYASRSGARAAITRGSASSDSTWPGMEAFARSRATVVRATGTDGDVRPDVAALLGYIAGRDALGAPELRR